MSESKVGKGFEKEVQDSFTSIQYVFNELLNKTSRILCSNHIIKFNENLKTIYPRYVFRNLTFRVILPAVDGEKSRSRVKKPVILFTKNMGDLEINFVSVHEKVKSANMNRTRNNSLNFEFKFMLQRVKYDLLIENIYLLSYWTISKKPENKRNGMKNWNIGNETNEDEPLIFYRRLKIPRSKKKSKKLKREKKNIVRIETDQPNYPAYNETPQLTQYKESPNYGYFPVQNNVNYNFDWRNRHHCKIYYENPYK